MKPALLIIDMQKAWLPTMDPNGQEVSLQLISGCVKAFHKHGFPVITACDATPGQKPAPGEPDFEPPEALGILPADIRVLKTHENAFLESELHAKLQELGCTTLFLCGLSAIACVPATYFGARDLGYTTFLLRDMLFSHSHDYSKAIENALCSIDIDTLGFMLRNVKWTEK